MLLSGIYSRPTIRWGWLVIQSRVVPLDSPAGRRWRSSCLSVGRAPPPNVLARWPGRSSCPFPAMGVSLFGVQLGNFRALKTQSRRPNFQEVLPIRASRPLLSRFPENCRPGSPSCPEPEKSPHCHDDPAMRDPRGSWGTTSGAGSSLASTRIPR